MRTYIDRVIYFLWRRVCMYVYIYSSLVHVIYYIYIHVLVTICHVSMDCFPSEENSSARVTRMEFVYIVTRGIKRPRCGIIIISKNLCTRRMLRLLCATTINRLKFRGFLHFREYTNEWSAIDHWHTDNVYGS